MDITVEELKERISNAEKLFLQDGADFVIDSVADIAQVLDEIEHRIKMGIKPKS